MPTRRRDPVSVPRTFYSASRPSYSSHNYAIDESISRAGFFSNAVLDDTEAAAARSRGKDYDLLRNTHSAIIDADMHSSPGAAAASRRARATSVPPKVQVRPMRLHQQLAVNRPQVVGSSQGAPAMIFVPSPVVASNPVSAEYTPAVQTEVPWRARASSVAPIIGSRSIRAGSMPPPRRVSVYHNESSLPALGTEALSAHRPQPIVVRSRTGSVPPQRPISIHYGNDDIPIRMVRAGSVQNIATGGLRYHRPHPVSRMTRAQSIAGLYRKPLDFGYDDELDRRTSTVLRRPKGLNELSRGHCSSRATSEPPKYMAPSETYTNISDVPTRTLGRTLFARRGQVGAGRVSVNPSSSINAQSSIYSNVPYDTTYLQASRAPMPKNERKPIRTVDGFTKPKNVMSWEHRVESRLNPDDLIYKPASFGRMRDQLRGTQEKMDKHRQLLDRYLDPDMKPVIRKNHAGSPHSSAGTDPANAPMSDVRRRVRRTLNATRSHRD